MLPPVYPMITQVSSLGGSSMDVDGPAKLADIPEGLISTHRSSLPLTARECGVQYSPKIFLS